MKIIFNERNMNIPERIEALTKEYAEQEKINAASHERMKEIKSTLGKLKTITKKAEQLFAEEPEKLEV